jgi:two-component system sensor histidine kinase ComP
LFSAAAFALALAPGSIADKPIAAIAEWVALVVFATYFALFFLSFPDDLLGYNRWFRAALLILSSGVILLSFLTLLQPLLYEVAALLRLVILLVYMLLGVGVGIFQFVTKRNQPERSGLAIISSGTLISILPFIGLFLLPTLFGRTPILIAEYAILPLAILPASFTYAILRHNVINISLLQRWLVHMSVWSILLVSYASIIYGAQWLVEGLERSTRSMIFAIGLVLFVGVSFDWLRTRLQQIFDRVIFKDSYEYRQALRALSYDLSNATNIDTLSISLSDPLRRLMNLDFALLLIQEPHGPRAVGGVGTYDPTFLNDLATAANNISINPQVISLGYGYLRVLVAPLRTHDVTVGHLCLGPKANGEAFRVTDKDLLATLSGQVAGVVQNAQLVAALQRQVKELDLLNDRLQHAQEKERARVSADIHDEPLQTAISLQRQLREVDSGSTLAAPIASSQLLVTQLRRVCLNMRPATLDDLGLFAALDQLIQEQSECHDIPIRLEVNANSIVEALPPSTTIVLYRAVQEALTNSLRHARPHSIEVCITQHECKVQLWVNDDGVGFTVPQRLEQLVTEGHLGLIGLRERVHHYGGNVFITSTIGKGTSIHIELPFQPETDV